MSSYMKIQKLLNTRQFKSWHARGCYISPQNVQRFAESLTNPLLAGDSITYRLLEVWLQGSTVLGQLLLFVFTHLYSVSHRGDKAATQIERVQEEGGTSVGGEKDNSLVPYCKGLDLIPSYPSVLDLNQLVFINSHLPQQYHREWRFLFSSEIHGESFSTLIGKWANH